MYISGLYILKVRWKAKNIQVSRVSTNKQSEVNIFGMSHYKRQDKNITLASLTLEEKSKRCRVYIDTHTDTSCARKHITVPEWINGEWYNVSPFHSKYDPIKK